MERDKEFHKTTKKQQSGTDLQQNRDMLMHKFFWEVFTTGDEEYQKMVRKQSSGFDLPQNRDILKHKLFWDQYIH